MHNANLSRLAILGAMMAVAHDALRALPDPVPAKPTATEHDRAKIEAAERKRQKRQAKRLAQKGGAA